jgi:MFS family permease
MDDAQRRSAQRRAIGTQVSGILDQLIYGNGIMLAYLGALGIAGSQALLLLSLPSWINAGAQIPLAHHGDRHGAKRLGTIGVAVIATGLVVIAVAGVLPAAWALAVVALGIAVHATGSAAFNATWFALLERIVPPGERGRFFSRMRLAWKSVSLVVAGLIAWWLALQPPVWALAGLMLAFAGLQAVRWLCYAGIPDRTERGAGGLMPAVLGLLRTPDLLPFGAYLFLLALCTGAVGWIIGLIGLEKAGMGGGGVVALGIAGALGALAGIAAGGVLVDRHGCKPVFLACHVGYAAAIVLVLVRGLLPWPEPATLLAGQFLFGGIAAAAGIAVTAESMALAPAGRRALALGLLGAAGAMGGAIAAAASAAALAAGLFHDGWTLGGRAMTAYDGILALCAFGVLVVTVTLGLVPSVFRRGDGTAAP